ncbi:hypothetical protein SBC2_78030 (plasmid) [Caballeronia sp. SBC2]|nr:hypothetical protein SBC2_78030 [Caballeronia sp. SBC2]
MQLTVYRVFSHDIDVADDGTHLHCANLWGYGRKGSRCDSMKKTIDL